MKQRATALISALFIVSLVAIIATALSLRLRIDIRRTQLLEQADQRILQSYWVDAWARRAVLEPGAHKYPRQFPAQKYQSFTIKGEIIDAQGLYNINNNDKAMFMRLLLLCNPGMGSERAQKITNGIHFTVRYASFTEIRRFMNADEFSRLAPHIIALPQKTTLNINHIDARVLAAAIPQLGQARAEQFVQEHRLTQNFKDLSQAIQQPLLAQSNVTLGSDKFSVQSDFYLVRAHVQQAQINTYVTSLYQIQKKAGRQQLLLRWRRL